MVVLSESALSVHVPVTIGLQALTFVAALALVRHFSSNALALSALSFVGTA